MHSTKARLILEIILILTLLIISYDRLIKLWNEEIIMSSSYLEDGIDLPSLTICSNAYKKFDQTNMTMEKFMQNYPSVLDYITDAKFYHGLEFTLEDVSTQTIINLLENATDEKLWKESYHLQTWTYYRLNRCVTLNSPIQKLTKPNYAWVWIDFNMTDTDSFLIEVHPRNQSRMNNVWSFTSMNHVVRKEIIWYYYGATIIKKLKTQKYDCIEENSMKITNCYDEFYMQSMNCSFPWLKINNQTSNKNYIKNDTILQKCGPNNTVDELKNLIRKVANLNNINPGKCMIPNCLNIEWKNTKTSMFEVPSWEKRAIAAFHFERAFSKVEVIEETLAYKFQDLFADFGGYLGLLLGASIMSFYDIILEVLGRLSNLKFKKFFSKK